MLKTAFAAIAPVLDVLLPPRKTERLVRGLNMETLATLASADGTLPYHEPRITALIWELKYRNNPHARTLAGKWLVEAALAIAEECMSTPVLVPVPMHASRRAQRGYNQTEELCKAIMKISGNSFLYEPHALERVRNTLPQQKLPRYRRLKNMSGAIEATAPESITGKTCIVVDDVSTTGATVHETKRALLAGGAKSVEILTLAHS